MCHTAPQQNHLFSPFLSLDSSALVHVKGFSTGVLPAWIPGSFIWNCVLCWVPFSDNGMNEHRMMSVRDALQSSVVKESGGRSC